MSSARLRPVFQAPIALMRRWLCAISCPSTGPCQLPAPGPTGALHNLFRFGRLWTLNRLHLQASLQPLPCADCPTIARAASSFSWRYANCPPPGYQLDPVNPMRPCASPSPCAPSSTPRPIRTRSSCDSLNCDICAESEIVRITEMVAGVKWAPPLAGTCMPSRFTRARRSNSRSDVTPCDYRP